MDHKIYIGIKQHTEALSSPKEVVIFKVLFSYY